MILVVGATGRLGGDITQRLLAGGWEVRVLLRRDSPADTLAAAGQATSGAKLIAAGAHAVYGDLKVPDSLPAALDGVHTVITTANSAHRGGADNPTSVDLEGNRALIDAARPAGVRQFVFISTNLADPWSSVPFLQAKGVTERHLEASGIPFTILAPTAFMDVWIGMVVAGPALANRPVVVVGTGERRHAFIAAADVAAFTVAAIGHPQAINKRLVIGGPEAVSFRDAARVFGRVLGRDVPVERVEPGAPIPHLPPFAAGMLAGFDMGESLVDMSELAPAFGVTLTPLEAVARRLAAEA